MAAFVNTSELKNQANRILRQAQRGPIIVTRRGHPFAAVVSIQEEDLEVFLWQFSPGVRRKIGRGLDDLRQGRVISAAQFARKHGVR